MLYLLNNRSVSRLSRHIQHVNYYHRVKLQWGLLPVLKLPQHHSSSGPIFDMWGWKQDMAALYWDTMPDWTSIFIYFFSCFAQNAARWAMQQAQLHLGSTLTVTWWQQCKHFQSAATFSQGPSLRTSDYDVWPPLNKGHPIKKIPWTHCKENPE